jgi:hypothetical protein
MECLRELNKKDTDSVLSDGQTEARQPSPQAAAAATESSPVISQVNSLVRLFKSEFVALRVSEHTCASRAQACKQRGVYMCMSECLPWSDRLHEQMTGLLHVESALPHPQAGTRTNQHRLFRFAGKHLQRHQHR